LPDSRNFMKFATMKYQVSYLEKTQELESRGGGFMLGGKVLQPLVHSAEAEQCLIGIDNRLYSVQVLSWSEDGQTLHARINGKNARITLKNETEQLLEKLGIGSGSAAGSGKIKAPMPGLIVKILVKPGDLVEKGQVLLNFEAMKMENQLKSAVAGEVKEVKVVQGDKVDKGQVLVEIG
jgi:biotin carboxyl carrier protein